MKNIIYTMILALTIQFGYSIGGIGLYGVSDFGTIDGISESIDFGDANITNNFIRKEGTSPVGLGGYFYLDIIPVVDVEIGGDIVFSTYDFEYSYQGTTPSGNPTSDDTGGTLAWAKTSYFISIQKPFVEIPMLTLYGGAGYKNAMSAPIMSSGFLSSLMETGDNIGEINDGDSLDKTIEDQIENQAGLMIEAGLRFKPKFFPFSMNVKLQQNFIKDVVPGKNSYMTVLVGLGFAL